jgi:hypothetical protein
MTDLNFMGLDPFINWSWVTSWVGLDPVSRDMLGYLPMFGPHPIDPPLGIHDLDHREL